MKFIKKLVWGLMSMSALLYSCESDDNGGEAPGPETTITLDQSSLSLEVGETGTLTATLDPEGSLEDIQWASSDPAIVTVSNGEVTAEKEGEATIVASIGANQATCTVTVTAASTGGGDMASLNGSDYYVIQLDETSFGSISDRVIQDLRPDNMEQSKNLYVWDNTFGPGTSTGTNAYGLSEGWISLVVGSVGWSGAGFHVGTAFGDIDMTRMFDNPDDYYLHLSVKATSTSGPMLLILTDGQAEAKVAIGGDYTDAGVTYSSYTDYEKDGEWHEVDIAIKDLNRLGLYFNATFTDANIFAILGGGNTGTTLDLDAIFFYKK
ncbi:Ig-like domain-containing protein [Sediminitomix flava]|uniref:Ig-like protein group 2 n=1 Tax=Sediminitomix flava TaxID=379075 RepID=A0A315ZCU0_SEDFL|nr:Ig-like domain-containing protein [Sediminitomix flava]PWJ42913.1 Ig-like protein group 2 [Sediminitomix flava]